LKPNPENVIAVLYYNKIRLTRDCIQSILDAGYDPGLVYCFDNGSQPGVFGQLTQEFPLCCHSRIDENLGYSGGFNRALEWVFSSGASSALFCTNDTLVKPGAAEACALAAGQTGAGMAAPLVSFISRPGVVDSLGAYFDAETGLLYHYRQCDLPTLLDPQKDYIPGTAVWINKDTFNRLGGTDESFHMYWEDVDMCFRAHRQGIPLARCPNALIQHGGSQTTRKKPIYTAFYFQRNRIRFCKRYLKGNSLDNVLNIINQELLKLESQWLQKEDRQRLQYLEQLRMELPG
jgi:hypothetical protein